MIGETGPMRSPVRGRRAPLALLAVLALLLAACGGGNDDGDDAAADEEPTYVAQVASYELVAGPEQRFLTGLVVQGTGTVVSFGSVDLEFFYLGTRDQPVDPPEARGSATASFLPIAGREAPPESETEPREVRPSEALGVYEATGVTFDAAGTWGVRVSATIDGEDVVANTAFPVRAQPRVPAPGMEAPRTQNPTLGSVGPNAPVLDSRASEEEEAPDPELHGISVADALAQRKPVVLVISTPVYCVSQFCGPITDSVSALAKRYGDRAAFVHIEVWEDFEDKKLNPSAREWLQPGGVGDLQEPWVFFVGGDGIVKERYDNVASDAQLEDATKRLVGA